MTLGYLYPTGRGSGIKWLIDNKTKEEYEQSPIKEIDVMKMSFFASAIDWRKGVSTWACPHCKAMLLPPV